MFDWLKWGAPKISTLTSRIKVLQTAIDNDEVPVYDSHLVHLVGVQVDKVGMVKSYIYVVSMGFNIH